MKKILIKIVVLLLSFVLFCSCSSNSNSNSENNNIIPQDKISYTHLEFGNVIDEGKQAVFLNFSSDYVVTKIEMKGTLLDKSGNTIHSFDTSMTLGSPSKNPDLPIQIDANLIKNVKSASFTTIKAYTTQEINSNE